MARACYLGSMQITLTSMQLADILAPHLPTGYCLYQANADEWQWQHPNRNAFGARQGPIGAFIDAWRDFDGHTSRTLLAKIRALVA